MAVNDYFMFKIDLIVWKYDIKRSINVVINEFKIDLIVWKYDIKRSINVVINEFKIDLIVWKFIAHEIIIHCFYGLK